jgi:glycosyltransferase involved in cell wall biosynthesis
MHILFLSDNFPPEVNAPATRTYEHCKEWVSSGAMVTVITCAPNFPQGKVFVGYRNHLWQSQMVDGIRVIRVWTFITSNNGFTLRILDYLSFMMSATLAAIFVRRVDVVIATSPQFFTACAGWFVGLVKRVPWVFELRDLWPESIKAVGAMKSSFGLRILEEIELFLYKQASCIVAVTHSFVTLLVQRGVDRKKILVITNGVNFNHFIPQEKDLALAKNLNLHDSFVVGYIGTHGMAHGLETILEAAQLVQNAVGGDRISFLFIGNGAKKEELISSSKSKGLQSTIFLDSISREDITRYFSLLDIAIIHLQKSELFLSVIPSKLFECMSMGIPVLHGVAGESSKIVLEGGVGEVFESGNFMQLAELILSLQANPNTLLRYRKNGVIAARHYDRKHLAAEMLDVLNRLVYK